MNFRARVAGVFGLSLVLVSCGGGGGAGPAGVQPQAAAASPEDMPAWVAALPEGELPRDNEHTDQAALFLFQAQSTDDPARQATLYQQAIGSAEAGMQLDPTNPQSHLQAGEAYLGLDDLAAADEHFTRAEELYPRYAWDITFYREQQWIDEFNAGVQALQVDDTQAAIAAFERAHAIYRGRPEAMIQLGALYSLNDQPSEAAEMFGAALEMMEGPMVERLEDPALLATFPENIEIARFQQAQLLFGLQRYDEAAELYQEVVEQNPDDLMAYSNLGASLVAAGETERASQVYTDLLARPGLGVREYNLIAIGAYNGDLFMQAADAFGRASQLLPQNRDFAFNQAQSLYLAASQDSVPGAWEQLLEVAPRVIELDTHNRNPYRFVLNALVSLGRQEDAIPYLEAMEAMAFELPNLQLSAVDGGYVLVGEVMNLTSAPGSQVSVTFNFLGEAGATVTSEQMTFTLAEPEVAQAFQVEVPTDAEILGYNYVVQ